MTGAAALRVENLTVRIDGTRLLEAVSLDATPGEITCVIGPSGAGKTTLLRAIAGLTTPTSGRVLLDGVDQASVPVHQRGLGLVAQDAALFPHLDVAGNVAFGLRMHGWDRAARNIRVDEVLTRVGLDGFGGRRVHNLSGGERQRVALARAIAPEPRVLLLDEPFGALDRARREHLVAELEALVRELGLCAVHVTHDQQEAATLATRLVVLREGRSVQHGAPHDVYMEPADAWVARFLGHRNVLAGDELPTWLRVLLGPTPDDHAVVVPEEAVRVRGTSGGEAQGVALRGHVREVHRPPARPGVRVEIDGSALWMALPTLVPALGGDVDIEVDRTTIRALPMR